MNHDTPLNRLVSLIEQHDTMRAIRSGLINVIPVLIIGAFALIFKSFPIDAYQKFIAEFDSGIFVQIFDIIYSATFGVLSLYMTVSISRSFVKLRQETESLGIAPVIAAFLCFFILAGASLEDFGTDSMGPKSMVLAIITGLGAPAVYLALNRFLRLRKYYLFSPGADRQFNEMLSSLLPLGLTVFLFSAANMLIIRLFNVDSFRAWLALIFDTLFSFGETGFLKGFFFVFFSSLLWFFGIHGSDTLEGVMQNYFAGGLAENQTAAVPTQILTKEFFDCFVLMGGCGSTICLLIAILLFSRNKAQRGLGLTAAFPMIFNINEMMVFGLPIILNPIMFIPFIAVPLLCYSVAYAALSLGLVPLITHSVEWTTPILLGGFRATGSVAGSILQLVNVCVGVACYAPFVRILDRHAKDSAMRDFEGFMKFFTSREQELAAQRVTDMENNYGEFAKALCAELRHNLRRGVVLGYQPQYDYSGKCIGAEALLRWNHPVFGMLYPPLVVKLCEEGGFLPELEEAVLKKALADRPKLYARFGDGIKLSVNVTGSTVVTPRFLQFCRQLNETEHFEGKNICLEVTEQAAISFTEETNTALRSLRKLGFKLAIDDFSMGQTSVQHLKNDLFDLIKLDGSLVKGLHQQNNCREIVSSLVALANTLGMDVLAEFVETEEDREMLHEMGCDEYQGYLYSPAVFLSDK